MTFSIVARDEMTDRIGIATASRFFAVGARNIFVRSCVEVARSSWSTSGASFPNRQEPHGVLDPTERDARIAASIAESYE